MIRKLLIGIIALLVFHSNALCQSTDELAVAAAATAFNKAIIDADKPALETLTSKALSYGHSGGQIDDQARFITPLANGTIDFTSIDITDQTIRITGKSAIIRNNFAGKFIREGKTVELKIGVLMVWEKSKGKWKLLARQGYKL